MPITTPVATTLTELADPAAAPAGAPNAHSRQIRFGFAFAVAMVITAAIVTYAAIQRELLAAAAVAHSHRVIERLDDLGDALSEAESSARGYAISDDPQYLALLPAQLERVRRDFAALRQLTAADPAQRDRLDQAQATLDAKLARIARVAAHHDPVSDSAQLARDGNGRVLMDTLRDRLGALGAAERRRLAAHAGHAELLSHLMVLALILGCAAALGAIGFAGSFIARALHAVNLTLHDDAHRREALRRLNEKLEVRVAERSQAAAQCALDLAQTRKDLHGESALLRELLERMDDGVVVCDPHLRPLRVNPAAERILGAGLARDQPLERLASMLEFLPAEDDEPLPPAEWPLMRALRGDAVDLVCLMRRRGDGAGHWVACGARPLRDERGTVQAAVMVLRDLTLERRAEASSATLAALAAAAPDAIVTLDPRGRVTSWNAAAERLFGFSADEMIGREPLALLPDDRQAEDRDLRARIAAGEPIEPVETERLDRDGRRLELALAAAPLAAPGGAALGVTLIFHDLGERNRTRAELAAAREAALAAVRERADFLASISHEIRTPLNGVIGMVELLLGTELTGDQRDLARTVASSGALLMRIVEDLLDYARLAAEKFVFDRLDFDLHDLLGVVADGFSERAAAAGLELALAIAPGAPRWLRGDPGRLRQIVASLLGHAVKFAERGEIVLVATPAPPLGDDRAKVNFEVRATEAGLAPAPGDSPFRPFARIDGAGNRRLGDSGLGLAIAAQLVQAMGGKLEFAALAGTGSRFSFALAFEPGEPRPADAANWETLRGLRALVVQDNATSRAALLDYLGAWGVEAIAAVGAEEALTVMRDRVAAGAPCEIVLADARMAAMDGAALARAIKADARLRAARVLLMAPVVEHAPEPPHGTDGWLKKPVNPARLQERLVEIARVLRAASAKVLVPAGGKVLPIRPLPAAAERARRPRARVLIIEDNPVNRKLALLQLRKLGYDGDAVDHARAGLDALAAADYAAVLMDCEMPEMDGYAATAEIRRREGADRHTVVIAMTAHVMEGAREKCLAAGMDDFVPKPVTLESLGATLERWLARDQGPEEPPAGLPAHEDCVSLDEAVIAELRALSSASEQDPVGELASLFQRDITDRIAAMQEMLAAGDGTALARASHVLKSAAAGLGMRRLAALSSELEDRARQADFRAAAFYFAQLRRELDLALPLLERARPSAKAQA